MTQVIVSLFFLSVLFILSFLVMTVGWGLTVQSWPMIIFGWFGMMVIPLVQALVND